MLTREEFEQIKKQGFKKLDYAHRNFSSTDLEEAPAEIEEAREKGRQEYIDSLELDGAPTLFPEKDTKEAREQTKNDLFLRLSMLLRNPPDGFWEMCGLISAVLFPYISFPNLRGEAREVMMYQMCDPEVEGTTYEDFVAEVTSRQ